MACTALRCCCAHIERDTPPCTLCLLQPAISSLNQKGMARSAESSEESSTSLALSLIVFLVLSTYDSSL